MTKNRNKLIALLILDIIVIVLIALNSQFAVFDKIAASIKSILNPDPEYNIVPRDRTKPSEEKNIPEDEQPQNIYPINVTFDAMGGTLYGEESIILDGKTLTIDNFSMPEVEYEEYDFVKWEKQEKSVKNVTTWEYYAVWKYSPIGYYTKILDSGDLELNLGTYTTRISEEETTYDILSQFDIRERFATIKLYSTATCEEENLVDEETSLNYGNNEYWIKIDAGENGSRIEKVNIYRLKTFVIEYELAGGTNNPANKERVQNIDNEITLAEPTKPGYQFLGWYYDSGFSESSRCPTTIDVVDNVIVYAKWSDPIEYSITYTPQSGVTLDDTMPTSYTINEQPVLPNATKAGYNFIGWWTDEANNIMFDQSTVYHKNLTVTPKFEAIVYTITYKLSGGEANNAETYTNNLIPTLTNPRKKGFAFNGWKVYDENNVEITYDPEFKYNKNIIMEAQYIDLLETPYLYGKYPQKVVSDSSLITELDGLTSNNGIYTHLGHEYVKIAATPFTDGLTFTNGETIITGKEYYFEIADVEWILIKNVENEHQLIGKKVIDASAFDDKSNIFKGSLINTNTGKMKNNLFTEYEIYHMNQIEPGMYIALPSSDEIALVEAKAQVTDYAIARGCYYNPTTYNAFYFYRDKGEENKDKFAHGYKASGEGESGAAIYIASICGIRPVIHVQSGDES